MADIPLMVTPEYAAEKTRFHPSTIRRLCASGKIRATKPNGQWRIYADDFNKWLQAGEPSNIPVKPTKWRLVPPMEEN